MKGGELRKIFGGTFRSEGGYTEAEEERSIAAKKNVNEKRDPQPASTDHGDLKPQLGTGN